MCLWSRRSQNNEILVLIDLTELHLYVVLRRGDHTRKADHVVVGNLRLLHLLSRTEAQSWPLANLLNMVMFMRLVLHARFTTELLSLHGDDGLRHLWNLREERAAARHLNSTQVAHGWG